MLYISCLVSNSQVCARFSIALVEWRVGLPCRISSARCSTVWRRYSFADFIEARLQTEKEFADSRVYGTVCYVLGILEEQITSIGNQITRATSPPPVWLLFQTFSDSATGL